jgi:hypothetical protein
MNRLGFRHDNLARTLPEVASSRNLSIDAVYTHFATADEPESAAFNEQRERFEGASATLQSLGIAPRARHAANSAALLRDERVWYNFVRPGLLLYGIVPPPLSLIMCIIGGSAPATPRMKFCVAPSPFAPVPVSHTTTFSNLMFAIAEAAVFESSSTCSSISMRNAASDPPQLSMIFFRPSPLRARISYWPRASASSLA